MITYTHIIAEKKQPARTELPAHLVHKVEVIEPGSITEGAKKIGEIITEMPEYESANIYMGLIVRLKYAALICLNSPI